MAYNDCYFDWNPAFLAEVVVAPSMGILMLATFEWGLLMLMWRDCESMALVDELSAMASEIDLL